LNRTKQQQQQKSKYKSEEKSKAKKRDEWQHTGGNVGGEHGPQQRGRLVVWHHWLEIICA
jgi:hypothetical protein